MVESLKPEDTESRFFGVTKKGEFSVGIIFQFL